MLLILFLEFGTFCRNDLVVDSNISKSFLSSVGLMASLVKGRNRNCWSRGSTGRWRLTSNAPGIYTFLKPILAGCDGILPCFHSVRPKDLSKVSSELFNTIYDVVYFFLEFLVPSILM